MFQLDSKELRILKSQIVTSSWGGLRTLPYVFTEQGVAMLSSVLKSERAIQVNIMIMRVFVKTREIISSHAEFGKKITELEQRLDNHDETIVDIIKALKKLLPVYSDKPKIGF
ncbi:MAG TPA: DNA-binding protein [Lentisphaeria bacterium]|nr:MAG: hypothetical protein A2X47_05795 [Lentisphaerae bacterium GWF2_38_69]HBM16096.1 DNA-binding protein [Lentisphaeria bacterium]